MIMLPGNPVSSFVSFEVFVRPVIKLMGAQLYVRRRSRRSGARDDVGLGPTAAGPRRGQLHRVRAAAGRAARGHGSHLLADLARANALVILPEQTEYVAAGEPLDVWLLEELLG